MPSTKIPGVTVNAAGQRIVDKEHRGVRIYMRLGRVSDQQAEQRLRKRLIKRVPRETPAWPSRH